MPPTEYGRMTIRHVQAPHLPRLLGRALVSPGRAFLAGSGPPSLLLCVLAFAALPSTPAPLPGTSPGGLP